LIQWDFVTEDLPFCHHHIDKMRGLQFVLFVLLTTFEIFSAILSDTSQLVAAVRLPPAEGAQLGGRPLLKSAYNEDRTMDTTRTSEPFCHSAEEWMSRSIYQVVMDRFAPDESVTLWCGDLNR
jgi:hypothetical protein